MILKQNTIYQVDSAILADPTRIRASWAPTLSISSGKIRLKVRVEGAIPTGHIKWKPTRKGKLESIQ